MKIKASEDKKIASQIQKGYERIEKEIGLARQNSEKSVLKVRQDADKEIKKIRAESEDKIKAFKKAQSEKEERAKKMITADKQSQLCCIHKEIKDLGCHVRAIDECSEEDTDDQRDLEDQLKMIRERYSVSQKELEQADVKYKKVADQTKSQAQ